MPLKDPEARRIYNHQNWIKYYPANRDKLLKQARRYVQANVELVRNRRRRYQERTKAEKQQYHRERRYGITPEQYTHLLNEQFGKCALCRRRSAVCIDHDHRTGKVRALLCRSCNIGLGAFEDDSQLLERAKEYLVQFNADPAAPAVPTGIGLSAQ